jgi:threonine dehydratase
MDAHEATALIRSVTPPTPLHKASLADGREVLLKREDLGPNHSFKWRGALTALEELRRDGKSGVVSASTGNHGAAVAWAAARLGLDAHIVVPTGAVEPKCQMIAQHGATLHRAGASFEETVHAARRLALELNTPFFEDGTSEAQLLGTGTIGLELRETPLDTVLIPLACGALAGGLGATLKSSPHPPTLIGVQSIHFSRMWAVLNHRPYTPTGDATLADGLADDRIVDPAFSYCRRYLDDVLTVDDGQLEAAIRELWDSCEIVVEGAAAAPLAALRAHPDRVPGSRIALIITGANIDSQQRSRILDSTPPTPHTD